MRNLLRLVPFMPVLMALSSCFPTGIGETELELASDIAEVRLAAEPISPETLIQSSLKLRCNRSWGLSVLDADGGDVDWVSASVTEESNLEEKITETEIVFTAAINPVNTPRAAEVVVSTNDGKIRIPLSQDGLVYKCVVKSPQAVDIDCIKSVSTVQLNSNTSWTAKLLCDGNDFASFSDEAFIDEIEGDGDSSIAVYFDENEDLMAERMARLVFSAEDCDDVEVLFTQQRNTPFLSVDREATKTEISASQKSSTLFFATNTDWSASIKEGSTVESVSLSAESGDKTVTSLEIQYSPSRTPVDKYFTVVLQVDGLDPVEVKFVQTGVVITLDFDIQPFEVMLPTSSGAAVTEAKEYVLMQSGAEYVFEIIPQADKGFYYHNSSKCLIYSGIGGMRLPMIGGYVLESVTLTHVATNKKISICKDADGTVCVEGGEQHVMGMNETYTWTLSGCKSDAYYYMCNASSGSRYSKLELVYEKEVVK